MDLEELKDVIQWHVTEIVYEEEDTPDMLEYLYVPITNTIHIYPYARRIGRETISLLRGFGGLLSRGMYNKTYTEGQDNEAEDQIALHLTGAMEQLTAIILSNLYNIELSKGEKLEVFNKMFLHMVGLSKTVWKDGIHTI